MGKLGYWVSGGIHLAFFAAMGLVHPPAKRTSRIVSVMMAAEQKAKPEPTRPEPKPAEPPPVTRSKPLNTPPRLAAKPAPAEPATQGPPKARLDALPDFGISLSGASLGEGMAVPMERTNPGEVASPKDQGPAARSITKERVHEKVLGPSNLEHHRAGDCTEPPTKPKPQGFVQPQYTDEARAAGIEGRVRIKLSIDASGNVSDATVLSGLGHGLDQAALAAVRRLHFSPATECGKPVASSFVISMRFVLGE